MEKIRVLVVDDSVVFRSQLRSALEGVDWIDLVGVASNGRLAIEKLKSVEVDLVTLDLEMPEMNGIETLKEIRRLGLKTKVIVFSSLSKKGAQITLDALELGAIDFVTKPDGSLLVTESLASPAILLRELLAPKIKELFKVPEVVKPRPVQSSSFSFRDFKPKVIVIGCSTGGPTALEKIFSGLRGPFSCPVLIVQHMPPIFTASLATRIGNLCGVPAAEGEDGEPICENRIYMAPGGYHMQIAKGLRIKLNQNEQENSVRPAVDPLFRTAAIEYPTGCLGIILTGMGRDGLAGCLALRAAKHPVIIQNRESCVVFGMPGAVYEASAYDSIQDLEQITQTLQNSLRYEQSQKQSVG